MGLWVLELVVEIVMLGQPAGAWLLVQGTMEGDEGEVRSFFPLGWCFVVFPVAKLDDLVLERFSSGHYLAHELLGLWG